MSKFLLIFFCFFTLNLKAQTLKCNFEEVYSDGSNQNGYFLIQERKLRYEYFSQDLYTLFYNYEDFYLVKNNDKNQTQKIKENTEVIKELIKIYNNFPNLNKNYNTKNFEIELDKSLTNNFYKRISIKSPQLNMSIYLNDCSFISVHEKFFQYNPYFSYL